MNVSKNTKIDRYVEKVKHNEPDDEHSWLLAELVLLSACLKVDLTLNGVAQVDLPVDHIGECGCARICKIGRNDINNDVPKPIPRPKERYVPSKSAIKVFAPLFKALMTIFLSVGPVISIRRSSRPGAGGAQCHEGSERMCAVSGGKSRTTPESYLRWASSRATSNDCLVDSKVLWRAARNLSAPSVKSSAWAWGATFE